MTYHTPGLDADLDTMPDQLRADRFRSMLDGWRKDVDAICRGHKPPPTALQIATRAARKRVSDLEPFTAIEDVVLIEKATFWTGKQIARALKRTPQQVYSRLKALGLSA